MTGENYHYLCFTDAWHVLYDIILMLRKDVVNRLKKAGIKRNIIQYYTDIGVIIPGGGKGEGTGHHHNYTELNCVEILVAKELANCGVKLESVKEVFDRFRRNPHARSHEALDPKGRLLNSSHVCIIVYDHVDTKKLHVDLSVAVPEIKIKRMHEHTSAIIVNVSKLWASL